MKEKDRLLTETFNEVQVNLEQARVENFRLELLEKAQLKLSSYLHQTINAVESVAGPSYLRRHRSFLFKAPTTSSDDQGIVQPDTVKVMSAEGIRDMAETLYFGSEEPSKEFMM